MRLGDTLRNRGATCTQHARPGAALPPVCARQRGASAQRQRSASVQYAGNNEADARAANPLEQLRATSDPRERARWAGWRPREGPRARRAALTCARVTRCARPPLRGGEHAQGALAQPRAPSSSHAQLARFGRVRARMHAPCALLIQPLHVDPLETLRAPAPTHACAPVPRAPRLLQSLDGGWAEHQASYVPSAAERLISSELGIWPHTVMLFALQTPKLQELDAETQARPGCAHARARPRACMRACMGEGRGPGSRLHAAAAGGRLQPASSDSSKTGPHSPSYPNRSSPRCAASRPPWTRVSRTATL